MNGAFKPRTERKYIGAYRPKIDGLEKASGKAKYADDLTIESKFPGLLYAKILRSPYPRARIKSIDTTEAKALHGVKAVVTFADPDVASLKPLNQSWTDGTDSRNYDSMWWERYKDRRVLSDYVCWVGDEAGVAVAAESEEIAEEALRRLRIEWDVLPFVLDMEQAVKPDAPLIHPDISPNSNRLPGDSFAGPDVVVQRGDAEGNLSKAEVAVEVSSRYSKATQGVLDKWCCLAQWDNGRLTVWSNSYEADQTRIFLSDMFGVPLNKVRVICSYVGAQMGRGDTGEQTFFIISALLAKRTGRPVKFRHTRRESFHDTRVGQLGQCRIGARRDGTITAIHLKLTANCGAYADESLAASKKVPQVYIQNCLLNVPNLKFEGYGVYTNIIPSSIMRGIGHVQTNFIMGLAIDALAEKLGMDPLDLVIKNFGWPPLPNKSLEAVLREGARRIGWENRHKPGENTVVRGTRRRGVGFSFHNGWHAAWQEVRRGAIQALIKINYDGSVILEAPTVETGPGSNTCSTMICAEALGVDIKDVHWVSTVDTDSSLKDQVQTDSAVSYVFAEAIHAAASDAKKQILELAFRELHLPSNELTIDNGIIHEKNNPGNAISLRDVMSRNYFVPIVGCASKTLPGELTGSPYMATFADVEVDTETGQVNVLKIVMVNDLGTVMYASGAEGQQIGGQCMSLGESLTEELVYDQRSGVPLNFDWINYKIPMMLDYPEIDPVLMEVWKGAGEYGACGMGESVVACTPRAIANAVYNAIGVRIDELPITPIKVLHALGKT